MDTHTNQDNFPVRKKSAGDISRLIISTNSNLIEKSKFPIIIKQMVFNVFFDGTLNNRYNTDAFEVNPAVKEQVNKDSDKYKSYLNAYSNIAHLFSAKLDNVSNVWIYIEGIGSTNGSSDD